ncbi:MAG: DUF2007 domain-containing protein [Acidobacteria bacterium]|nr:DUF2007 domain-containing protein [Acidobacteriota bacterium]
MNRGSGREGWVKLMEFTDPVKAELALGCLQSSEIEAVLEAVPLSMLTVTVGGSPSRYRLWVEEGEEESALRLLREQVPEDQLERAASEAPEDSSSGSSSS